MITVVRISTELGHYRMLHYSFVVVQFCKVLGVLRNVVVR